MKYQGSAGIFGNLKRKWRIWSETGKQDGNWGIITKKRGNLVGKLGQQDKKNFRNFKIIRKPHILFVTLFGNLEIYLSEEHYCSAILELRIHN